ncbi:MAG: hypothetical protein QF449_01025 [Alphaproteobacteria bacterium]|nr:hypothetical protein [Rhodospirillales bacterium]MDP6816605.1 hypothetical protein [Alphaproteobacteria bacterium]
MSDKTRSSPMALAKTPPGKAMMPTRAQSASALEQALLGELDREKLSDLAKVLFTLNNRRHGPIPGFYVVVCTKAEEEWCVGQLCADSEKPLMLLEDRLYDSPEAAQAAAERLKAAHPASDQPGYSIL